MGLWFSKKEPTKPLTRMVVSNIPTYFSSKDEQTHERQCDEIAAKEFKKQQPIEYHLSETILNCFLQLQLLNGCKQLCKLITEYITLVPIKLTVIQKEYDEYFQLFWIVYISPFYYTIMISNHSTDVIFKEWTEETDKFKRTETMLSESCSEALLLLYQLQNIDNVNAKSIKRFALAVLSNNNESNQDFQPLFVRNFMKRRQRHFEDEKNKERKNNDDLLKNPHLTFNLKYWDPD